MLIAIAIASPAYSLFTLLDSSYGWTSLEAWKFLHSIYGGGPEYKVVRKSSMVTTDNEGNEERDLSS